MPIRKHSFRRRSYPWRMDEEQSPAQPDGQDPGGEPSGSPWMYGPPWQYWSGRQAMPPHWPGGPAWHGNPPWQGKQRFLFRRFARFVAFLALIFVLGVAGLSFLFSRTLHRPGIAAVGVLIVSILIIIGSVMFAISRAARSFARSMEPLARVMAAADAVSEGNLNTRVPEDAPGEFGRLQVAFNRMVTELQRTDQQRRNLTADVAHELRTPLHVIQGNLEGILDGVYPADTAQVELLLDETRQLARLVEDLRTLSLAEAGQLPLHFEAIDVNDLLQDVATSFSGQAESAGVALAAEIHGSLLTIQGDPGRLDQVLSNLVANALRHTPAGGSIHLRAEPLPGDPPHLRITVTDTGSGIPAEDLPFIFDRFWRGDRARQKDGQGSTGLGLAITRQLVQAHGGRIAVESRPGEGTVFTIDLPAGPAPD